MRDGQAPPSVWGHLQMAAPTHTKLPARCWHYRMVPLPGPGAVGAPAQRTWAELAPAPSPAPSLWHCAAPSLGRGGQGAWMHQLQVPPELPGRPGAAPGSDSNKCQGKAPSYSAIHPASPGETLWSLLSPVLSSAEGNGPFLCGPGPQGCAGGDRDGSGDNADSSSRAGSAAFGWRGWGRPGWEQHPAGCAAPGIRALSHAGEDMQKRAERR